MYICVCVHTHIQIDMCVYLCEYMCVQVCRSVYTCIAKLLLLPIQFKTKFLPSCGGRAGKVLAEGPVRSEHLRPTPRTRVSSALIKQQEGVLGFTN